MAFSIRACCAALARRLLLHVRSLSPWEGALIVLTIASLTFLMNIGKPTPSFWDEAYYLSAVERYHDGIAQFASHPPLGLMLLAASDAVLRPNRGVDTRQVGWDKKVRYEDLPPHYAFIGVRIASAAFAV